MGRRSPGRRGPPDPAGDAGSDPANDIQRLLDRERQRSGPGSAARRAVEALEDARRLGRELDGLYDD